MSMFFLMCSERSGSNFITKLLNGHNNICGPSTKHIINPVARNLFRYKDLKNESNWNELLVDIHRLMSVGFSIWEKEFNVDELKKLAPTGDIESLIRNIFMEEAKANGKQHVFIKENQVYEFLPFLLLNFPEAKYIYQTRDPRDMALSWKKHTNHPGGVVQAARQWQKDQQNSLKNYDELAKRGKAYFVHYEDLISDADKYTSEIIHFLGLPQDANIENFHKDELTQKNAGMHKAWNNLSQGVIKDNKNKYLNELSEMEVKVIEKICYYEMKFLGYICKYSKEELEEILEEDIERLNRSEFENIQYESSEGVRLNMEAKKIFYNKLIDEL
ncbi:sulfotransferase [Sulfurimonas sp.]|uniref:sulfotransferase n=1 Tax=Sulfurimonas sp. TaxID=2022749 RepID=UPI00263A0B35|nr:sulfotransferase [Sulfurimonas sp.]MDD5157877.1 sulfotransferase [Sulfurimonas sp.]